MSVKPLGMKQAFLHENINGLLLMTFSKGIRAKYDYEWKTIMASGRKPQTSKVLGKQKKETLEKGKWRANIGGEN